VPFSCFNVEDLLGRRRDGADNFDVGELRRFFPSVAAKNASRRSRRAFQNG